MIQRTERENWFLARIGRVLYRIEACSCEICRAVYENGIFVHDRNQAIYLYDIECAYNADGDPLRYFDTLAERDEYEKTLLTKANEPPHQSAEPAK